MRQGTSGSLAALPQDAGEAILKYLKRRPAVAIDQVFLCVQAPYRSMQASLVVSSIVDHALSSAAIENPPSGCATLLRHSAATSMLRGGATSMPSRRCCVIVRST